MPLPFRPHLSSIEDDLRFSYLRHKKVWKKLCMKWSNETPQTGCLRILNYHSHPVKSNNFMNNFGSIYWVVILGKKFSRFWVEDFLSVLSFSPEKNFFRGSDKYNVSKPKLEIIFCNSDRCNVRFENEAPSLSATLLSAFQKALPLAYTSGSRIRV